MIKTANVQGFKINLLKYAEALDFVKISLDNGENIQIVTINPEMIEAAKQNPSFADVLKYSELVVPDGVGIKLALKFKGIEQEQIRGVDFAQSLIELSEQNGYKLALIGAKPEINQKLAEVLKEKYPKFKLLSKAKISPEAKKHLISASVTWGKYWQEEFRCEHRASVFRDSKILVWEFQDRNILLKNSFL